MEFAPDWLRSAGSQPAGAPGAPGRSFQVAELPGRIGYATKALGELFAVPIEPRSHADFVDYVVSLNRNGLGWVDLLVQPGSGLD